MLRAVKSSDPDEFRPDFARPCHPSEPRHKTRFVVQLAAGLGTVPLSLLTYDLGVTAAQVEQLGDVVARRGASRSRSGLPWSIRQPNPPSRCTCHE